MNDEKQKKKKKAHRATGPRTEWAVGDVIRFKFLLDNALNVIDGHPHFWASLQLQKMIDITKNYQETLERHDDFQAYVVDEKAGYDGDKLRETYPEFTELQESLKKGNVELSIPKFKVDWCLKHRASGFLSAALIEFGLFDDPQRGEDLLYRNER